MHSGKFLTTWRLRVQVLALCLVAWPGPVPVIHSHAEVTGSTLGDRLLVKHVHRFHVATDLIPDSREWHIHWVLRSADCVESSRPLLTLTPDQGGQINVLWALPGSDCQPSLDGFFVVPVSLNDGALHLTARSFLATEFFARGLSLPERVGVRLC